MIAMMRLVPAALLLTLAACVAPEQPDPPKLVRTAPAVDTSSATYEAAPTPNRRIGRPTGDEIIRIAH